MIINQNVFQITNSSPEYSCTGVAIVITDYRLKFINDVVVFSTQTETEYRKSSLSLDAVNGILTITALPLNDDEHLTITLI